MEKVIYILLLLILLLIKPNRLEVFDEVLNLQISVIFIIGIICHFYSNIKKTSNWLRFDVIFLIGFAIVHFQIPFLASIGIEPTRPNFIWINKNVVNFATWMSAVAIILWMLGYSLYSSKKTIKPVRHFLKPKLKINYIKYDIILSITLVFFLALVGSKFFSGVYDGGNTWGAGANYVYLVLRVLLYLRIVYIFQEMDNKSSILKICKVFISNKLFFTVFSIFFVLFLISGDRGPLMQLALVIAGSYSIFIKPIPFKSLLIFIVAGAFIFTILGMGRSRDESEVTNGNIFERGLESYQNKEEEENLTNELASSVRIQYRALDVVPYSHPYLYGITFVTVGLGTIPFLGSTIIDVFDIPQRYTATSSFFTFLGQGHFATFGEGSEILADIYVNFGIEITFLIMFFLGMFCKVVTVKSYQLNINYIVIYLGLLIYALSMNRAMLLTPLKDIAYFLTINFIFIKLYNAK